MAAPFALRPDDVPLHKLFPAQYRATRSMIWRDFALLGGMVVGLVVTLAALYG